MKLFKGCVSHNDHFNAVDYIEQASVLFDELARRDGLQYNTMAAVAFKEKSQLLRQMFNFVKAVDASERALRYVGTVNPPDSLVSLSRLHRLHAGNLADCKRWAEALESSLL
jgi:hypothetical protein